MNAISLPEDLTASHWKKKKPILAMTQSTGITEALKELARLHGKVDWESMNFTAKSFDDLEEEEKTVKQYFQKHSKLLMVQAKEVKILADTWTEKFEEDDNKKAAKATKEVAAAAKEFIRALGDASKELDKAAESRSERIKKGLGTDFERSLNTSVEKISHFIKRAEDFSSDPTVENLARLTTPEHGVIPYLESLEYWDEKIRPLKPLCKDIFTGKMAELADNALRTYDSPKKLQDWKTAIELEVEKGKRTATQLLEDHAQVFSSNIGKANQALKHFKALIKELT